MTKSGVEKKRRMVQAQRGKIHTRVSAMHGIGKTIRQVGCYCIKQDYQA